MKDFDKQLNQAQIDQFGQASAALLRKATLPPEIKDRLYAARLKAIALQKPEKVLAQKPALASTSGSWSSGSSSGVWDTIGWLAPLAVLVFGLIGIAQWQDDSRIKDIAEVDAALLTDDVPPDAYADKGFMAFLKNGPISDSSDDSSSSVESK